MLTAKFKRDCARVCELCGGEIWDYSHMLPRREADRPAVSPHLMISVCLDHFLRLEYGLPAYGGFV